MKVVPVRVALVVRMHTLVAPKVVPERVFLWVINIPLLNRRLSLKGLSLLIRGLHRQGSSKTGKELISLRSRKVDRVALLFILKWK